jgi:hypothetical protein
LYDGAANETICCNPQDVALRQLRVAHTLELDAIASDADSAAAADPHHAHHRHQNAEDAQWAHRRAMDAVRAEHVAALNALHTECAQHAAAARQKWNDEFAQKKRSMLVWQCVRVSMRIVLPAFPGRMSVAAAICKGLCVSWQFSHAALNVFGFFCTAAIIRGRGWSCRRGGKHTPHSGIFFDPTFGIENHANLFIFRTRTQIFCP